MTRGPFLAVLALLLSGALAGCTNPFPHSPTTSPFKVQCIRYRCLADPNSHDAQFALQKFGLTQITDGANFNDPNLAISGDWVVWQDYSAYYKNEYTFNGTTYYALLGYNIRTHEFLPIAMEWGVDETTPIFHGDQMLYRRAPTNGTMALSLWNATTRQTTFVHTGLASESWGRAFDGTWVILPGSDGIKFGYWAANLRDHRLIDFYKPYYENRKPDGTHEDIRGVSVANNTLIYSLTRWNKNSTAFSSSIYVLDLNTNLTRGYPVPYGLDVTRSRSDGRYVAVESALHVYVLDLQTGEWRLVSKGQYYCSGSSIASGWLAYGCEGNVPLNVNLQILALSNTTVINLATWQRYVVGETRGNEFPEFEAATDGKTLLAQMARDDPKYFNHVGTTDFYYIPIANMNPERNVSEDQVN